MGGFLRLEEQRDNDKSYGLLIGMCCVVGFVFVVDDEKLVQLYCMALL